MNEVTNVTRLQDSLSTSHLGAASAKTQFTFMEAKLELCNGPGLAS